MRYVSIPILLSVCLAYAEANPGDSLVANPSRYFYSFRSGMVFCSECRMDGLASGLLSTVHGIRLNKTFAVGIGVGVTLAGNTWLAPIVGHAKMNLFGKKNKVFVELNYGGALALFNYERSEYETRLTTCKTYFQPSIGYSIPYHDMRIGILVGIQALKLNTHYVYPGYNYSWGINRQGTPNTVDLAYQVSRMLIGLSIGFRD